MKTIISIVLMVSASFCLAHDQAASESALSQHKFFQALGFTRFNAASLSPEQAIEQSAVVIKGRIHSVTEGRIIQNTNGYSRPIITALFKVEVSQVLKGDVGKFVFFEYVIGGMPIKHLNANKFPGEMILLLREPTWNKQTYTFTNSTNGLMSEVKTLYTLTTQRGLLVEDRNSLGDTNIVQPLVPQADPLFPDKSFEDLEQEVSVNDTGHGFNFRAKSPETP